MFCMRVQGLALDAVNTVAVDVGDGKRDIDIKKYAKIEKIPGGALEESRCTQTKFSWQNASCCWQARAPA